MITAAELLNSDVVQSAIGVIGLAITGGLTYLGVRAQVQKVGTSVSELSDLNTEQHGMNSHLLARMLDTIAEQGVMVSMMVNVQDRPIFKTDPEGALLQVNAAGVKLLGMTQQELTGDGWVKAVHPEDRHMVFTAWTDSVREARPFGPISYRYLHPVTKVITLVEAVATPVINSDNQVISWVAILVPITELEGVNP